MIRYVHRECIVVTLTSTLLFVGSNTFWLGGWGEERDSKAPPLYEALWIFLLQSIQKPPPKRLKLSTDSGIDLASTSVATQTDPLSPPTTVSRDLQTNPPTSLPPPSPHTCSSLNNSFCVHKKQAAEKISTVRNS